MTLRDALGSDAVLTLTPATAKADVACDKALPPPAPDAPNVAEAVARPDAIEAGLNKCFAAGPR